MDDDRPDIDALLAHRDFVRGLACALLRDPALADDVAQDTWLAALEGRTPTGAALRAWLARVVRHLGLNQRREERRRRARERSAARPEATPSTSEIVAREAVRQQVVQAVLALPEPHRTIVLQRYYEGRSAAEIARSRGRAASTVRVQLREGLANVRARLDAAHREERKWTAILATWAAPARTELPLALLCGKRAAAAAALVVVALAAGVAWLRPGQPSPPAATPVRPLAVHDRDARPTDEPRARVTEDAAGAGDTHAAQLTLRGLVLAPDDSPVVEAEVALLSQRTPRAIRTAHTDRAGRFVLRARRAVPYRVRVAADGFATHVEADCFGGQQRTLRLQLPAALEGSITRRDGTPVEDAQVQVYVVNDRARHLTEARSDAAGRFLLDGLEPGLQSVSIATNAGRPPRRQRVELVPGATTRHDVVIDDVWIEGRVTDASGLALGGAEVGEAAERGASVRAGADGRFRLAAPAPGTGELFACAPGYVTAMRTLDEADGEGALRGFDFALRRAGEARGRIVDAAGAPVAGAAVALCASFGTTTGLSRTWCDAMTDAHGRFVIGGVDPERAHALHVRAEGFGVSVYELPRRVVPGGTTELTDVVLHAEAIVEGTVWDGDGHPMAEVSITLRGTNADRHAWLSAGDAANAGGIFVTDRGARTDAEGIFRFADVAAGRYELFVYAAGGVRGHRTIDVPRAGLVTGADVELHLGLAIRGEVRTAGGARTGRVYVAVEPLDGQADGHPLLAAPDGRFAIRGLARGRYRLTVRPIDTGLGLPRTVDCEAGIDDLVVQLAAAATITGRVLDRAGAPLAARVRATRAGQPDAFCGEANTDAQGRFVLEVPEGQVVDLAVRVPGEGLLATLGTPLELRDPARARAVLAPVQGLELRAR